MKTFATIAPSADVDDDVRLGAGSRVWQLAQIRTGASVGRDCSIGRGAYIGVGVQIGDRVKVQNYALVYEPARLGNGVFVGPAAILTNDLRPRAVNPDGTAKSSADWRPLQVTVQEGASLGAGSICVAPVNVGRWAMVAAGSVVTSDVPDHGLMVGVPARQIGWVGRSGARLEPVGPSRWRCPSTGECYTASADGLTLDDPNDVA